MEDEKDASSIPLDCIVSQESLEVIANTEENRRIRPRRSTSATNINRFTTDPPKKIQKRKIRIQFDLGEPVSNVQSILRRKSFDNQSVAKRISEKYRNMQKKVMFNSSCSIQVITPCIGWQPGKVRMPSDDEEENEANETDQEKAATKKPNKRRPRRISNTDLELTPESRLKVSKETDKMKEEGEYAPDILSFRAKMVWGDDYDWESPFLRNEDQEENKKFEINPLLPRLNLVEEEEISLREKECASTVAIKSKNDKPIEKRSYRRRSSCGAALLHSSNLNNADCANIQSIQEKTEMTELKAETKEELSESAPIERSRFRRRSSFGVFLQPSSTSINDESKAQATVILKNDAIEGEKIEDNQEECIPTVLQKVRTTRRRSSIGGRHISKIEKPVSKKSYSLRQKRKSCNSVAVSASVAYENVDGSDSSPAIIFSTPMQTSTPVSPVILTEEEKVKDGSLTCFSPTVFICSPSSSLKDIPEEKCSRSSITSWLKNGQNSRRSSLADIKDQQVSDESAETKMIQKDIELILLSKNSSASASGIMNKTNLESIGYILGDSDKENSSMRSTSSYENPKMKKKSKNKQKELDTFNFVKPQPSLKGKKTELVEVWTCEASCSKNIEETESTEQQEIPTRRSKRKSVFVIPPEAKRKPSDGDAGDCEISVISDESLSCPSSNNKKKKIESKRSFDKPKKFANMNVNEIDYSPFPPVLLQHMGDSIDIPIVEGDGLTLSRHEREHIGIKMKSEKNIWLPIEKFSISPIITTYKSLNKDNLSAVKASFDEDESKWYSYARSAKEAIHRESWATSLRPHCTEEWLGSESAVKEIKHFVKNWNKKLRKEEEMTSNQNSKKTKKKNSYDSDSDYMDDDEDEENKLPNPLIICGPVGIGKTSLIRAVCEEMNMKVLEVHPGERRNGAILRTKLGGAGASHRVQVSGGISSFFSPKVSIESPTTKQEKKLTLIVVEHIDVHFSEEDKDFFATIKSLAQEAKVPVIWTCNSLPTEQLQKEPELQNYRLLEISPNPENVIAKYSKTCVLAFTRINLDLSVLIQVIRKARGDLRATLNNLQMMINSYDKEYLELDTLHRPKIESSMDINYKPHCVYKEKQQVLQDMARQYSNIHQHRHSDKEKEIDDPHIMLECIQMARCSLDNNSQSKDVALDLLPLLAVIDQSEKIKGGNSRRYLHYFDVVDRNDKRIDSNGQLKEALFEYAWSSLSSSSV